MMTKLLDLVAEELTDILNGMRNNNSISQETLERLQKSISSIMDIHNELCRIDEE